jgi:hypothetical protein
MEVAFIMTGFELELPFEFDAFCGQIRYYLRSGFAPGVVEAELEDNSPGIMTHRLSQDELGDLGLFTIRKGRSQEKLWMIDEGVPRPPSRDPTSEELEAIAAISDPEERRKAYSSLTKKIGAERDELYRGRQEHKAAVMRGLLDRLRCDPEWGADTHEIYVPKTQAARDKWKEAYPIIKETIEARQEEYRRGADYWEEEPKPKWADYVRAIQDEGVNYGKKSIQRIIKAGDAGLLK